MPGVPRLVLDPGVLVAALITPLGPPAHLLSAARAGQVELVVSPLLLAELTRVLQRRKFRRYAALDEAREFVEGLPRVALTVADPEVEAGVTRDPDDDYLVALARASGADALVSGDRDILDANIRAPRVLSPRQAVQRFLAE